MSLRDRLVTAMARAAEVEAQLSDPATARDSKRFAELGRERRQLQVVVPLAERLERAERELDEVRELANSDDEEMASEARAEEQRLTDEIAQIELELKPALLPPVCRNSTFSPGLNAPSRAMPIRPAMILPV